MGCVSLTTLLNVVNIQLFPDTDLLAWEIADITKRTEKKNSTMELKKWKISGWGEGCLTDEDLKVLESRVEEEGIFCVIALEYGKRLC